MHYKKIFSNSNIFVSIFFSLQRIVSTSKLIVRRLNTVLPLDMGPKQRLLPKKILIDSLANGKFKILSYKPVK